MYYCGLECYFHNNFSIQPGERLRTWWQLNQPQLRFRRQRREHTAAAVPPVLASLATFHFKITGGTPTFNFGSLAPPS